MQLDAAIICRTAKNALMLCSSMCIMPVFAFGPALQLSSPLYNYPTPGRTKTTARPMPQTPCWCSAAHTEPASTQDASPSTAVRCASPMQSSQHLSSHTTLTSFACSLHPPFCMAQAQQSGCVAAGQSETPLGMPWSGQAASCSAGQL